ncbi:MAG: hypothetical protein QXW06_00635 [Thermoplasmata archaeon]
MIYFINYRLNWSYNFTRDEWGNFNETSDNLHNFWEGEDLDLDGAVDTGSWGGGSGPGETNSSKWDTDSDEMPDGWEAWYRINPLSNSGDDGTNGTCDDMYDYRAPWDFTSGAPVNEYVPNRIEYIAGSNPRVNDTDGDKAKDDVELGAVIMRTNVSEGGFKYEAYDANLTNTTIWFKGKNWETGKLYTYSCERNWTEPLVNGSRWGGIANHVFIKFFDEYSFVSLNRSANEILVAKMRPVGQVVMFEAHIYTFTCASSQSTNPTDRHREVYITEPASANSDGTLLGRRIDLANGIMDGEEPSGYEDGDDDGLRDS